MQQIYNKNYYEHYDVGIEKVNYANSKYTKEFWRLLPIGLQMISNLKRS